MRKDVFLYPFKSGSKEQQEAELAKLQKFTDDAEVNEMWLRLYANPDICFSPAELRMQNESGKFILTNLDNWELIDPKDVEKELMASLQVAQNDLINFRARMWASEVKH